MSALRTRMVDLPARLGPKERGELGLKRGHTSKFATANAFS
jgi:hypothetical protein